MRRIAITTSVIFGLTMTAILGGCGLKEEPGIQSGGVALGDDDLAPGLGAGATATANTVRIVGEDSTELVAGAARAVFPATSASTRPNAVTLVDSENWQGAVAAAALAGNRVKAPILLSDGGDLPDSSRATLARLDPTGVEALDGTQVFRIGDVATPAGLEARAVTGVDQYALAAEIDKLTTEALGRPSGHVMIVSGEQAEWAMPAAAWAARSGNPVLFTQAGAVPDATLRALREHKDPHVYLLGPESVISKAVEQRLEGFAEDVTRIDGATPVEMAVAFARFKQGSFGWGFVTPGHSYTVASTNRPIDAAAAASLGSNGVFAPLLLTDSPEPLPRTLDDYLLDVQPGYTGDPSTGVFNRVFVLGDDAVVSGPAQGRLDEITELVQVTVGR